MSFTTLLNQSVTIYRKSGYGNDGRPTTSTPATASARVQKTTKQRLLPNNSLVTIVAIAYVLPNTVVEVEDRVDYGNDKYKVFSKNVAVDGDGDTHHIKLELQKWQT